MSRWERKSRYYRIYAADSEVRPSPEILPILHRLIEVVHVGDEFFFALFCEVGEG